MKRNKLSAVSRKPGWKVTGSTSLTATRFAAPCTLARKKLCTETFPQSEFQKPSREFLLQAQIYFLRGKMNFCKLCAILVLGFLCLFTSNLPAQEKPQEKPAPGPAPAATVPAANPKDVESIDAIMAALYGVISGPAGERDWNRFRSLFLPEARMGAVRKTPDGKFNAAS